MTTRTLAWTAFWLAVLLGLLGVVAAHRFGYLVPVETPQWEFHNVLLDTRPGTLVDLNPGRVDQVRRRFWFLRVFAEPDTDDPSISHSPVGRYAHYRAAVSEQRPHEEGWYFMTAAVIAFRQLGSVGSKEWLMQIGLVREKSDTGSARDLLQASFANTAGARINYSYDPGESLEEAARRGFGWVHMIQAARQATSEVFFSEPTGFMEPPPSPAKTSSGGND